MYTHACNSEDGFLAILLKWVRVMAYFVSMIIITVNANRQHL